MGEEAGWFSKDSIDEFKGIRFEPKHPVPFHQPYWILNRCFGELPSLFPTGQFPFQITQKIINGEWFFKFVRHYAEVFDRLFSEENAGPEYQSFHKFYQRHTKYDGSHRGGDSHVRNLFEAVILLYFDHFGTTEPQAVRRVLFCWAYALRRMLLSVQYRSVDKHIRENGNPFKTIDNSYHPRQPMNIRFPQERNFPVRPKEGPGIKEIEELFSGDKR